MLVGVVDPWGEIDPFVPPLLIIKDQGAGYILSAESSSRSATSGGVDDVERCGFPHEDVCAVSLKFEKISRL
jgi:hypothetical protein